MRSRKKMETTRTRKANAVVKEKEVLYFVQDRDVSTRMLAILSVSKTKSIAKKMIKEAIDHNPPFKHFLEANHLYGKYVSSAVKCCTEIKNSFREDPSAIAYTITCRKDIRRIINETLTWSKTNQGTSFWSNVYSMAGNIE